MARNRTDEPGAEERYREREAAPPAGRATALVPMDGRDVVGAGPSGPTTSAVDAQAGVSAVRNDGSRTVSPASQVHLRLLPEDVNRLRQLADRRGQTLSGAVRYLLRQEERARRT